jgi:hypothetical protein
MDIGISTASKYMKRMKDEEKQKQEKEERVRC